MYRDLVTLYETTIQANPEAWLAEEISAAPWSTWDTGQTPCITSRQPCDFIPDIRKERIISEMP